MFRFSKSFPKHWVAHEVFTKAFTKEFWISSSRLFFILDSWNFKLDSWNQISLDSWIVLDSILKSFSWAFCHLLCYHQNTLNQSWFMAHSWFNHEACFYTSFTCQNIIQFLDVSKLGIYTPNKKNQGTNYRRVDNKTQLSPKINSNIITSAWRLQHHLLLLIYSHERKFTIIIGTNHTTQNCKGEFIIKDQQTPNDID